MKWLFVALALVTFFLIPFMPLYGFVRPWPEAEHAVRRSGISGALLMLGGGWSSSYSASSAGGHWSEERQRSFIAIPESLHSGDLYTYIELRGSEITGARSEVVRDKLIVFTFIMWLLSGIASSLVFRRWRKKGPNKAPEPTTMAVTSRAPSSTSRASHGRGSS